MTETPEERYKRLLAGQRATRNTTEDERVALQDYVANSDRFNWYLRRPPEDDENNEHLGIIKRDVANLRTVIERSTLPEDVVLYRAVELPDTLQHGDTWTDPGFISASLDEEFAERFRRQHPGKRMRIMEIPVPAGTPVLVVNNTFEREMILLDNQPVSIDQIDDDRLRVRLG